MHRRHRLLHLSGSATTHMRLPRLAWLTLTVALAACSLDSSPALSNGATKRADGSESQLDASFRPSGAQTGVGQLGGDSGPRTDAEPADTTRDVPKASEEDDAGATRTTPAEDAGGPRDAGVTANPPTTAPATVPDAGSQTSATCSRAALRQQADAFLLALASGAPTSLRLHPMVRYTENGRDEALGGGVWGRRAETQFARHVVDETRCSTVTQAVLTNLTGRIGFGVRLQYRDDQLLEIEAQAVPEVLANTDFDAVVPAGSDAWIEPVPEAQRMSRVAMEQLIDRYFDSATSGAEVPPSAPACRRRQNGVPMAAMGSCAIAPGDRRFEQRRVLAVDETNGSVAAAVLYNGHLGFYLVKLAADAMQDIEVIGGASTSSSGW